MGVADVFRLRAVEARSVLADVARATAGWRQTAKGHGLDDSEIERMTRAFEHEEADVARSLA